MRAMPLALTCCACLLSPITTADVRAEAVKATPELTVFTEEQSSPADGQPTVLRGSATRRGTVDGRFGDGFSSRPAPGWLPAPVWVPAPRYD